MHNIDCIMDANNLFIRLKDENLKKKFNESFSVGTGIMDKIATKVSDGCKSFFSNLFGDISSSLVNKHNFIVQTTNNQSISDSICTDSEYFNSVDGSNIPLEYEAKEELYYENQFINYTLCPKFLSPLNVNSGEQQNVEKSECLLAYDDDEITEGNSFDELTKHKTISKELNREPCSVFENTECREIQLYKRFFTSNFTEKILFHNNENILSTLRADNSFDECKNYKMYLEDSKLKYFSKFEDTETIQIQLHKNNKSFSPTFFENHLFRSHENTLSTKLNCENLQKVINLNSGGKIILRNLFSKDGDVANANLNCSNAYCYDDFSSFFENVKTVHFPNKTAICYNNNQVPSEVNQKDPEILTKGKINYQCVISCLNHDKCIERACKNNFVLKNLISFEMKFNFGSDSGSEITSTQLIHIAIFTPQEHPEKHMLSVKIPDRFYIINNFIKYLLLACNIKLRPNLSPFMKFSEIDGNIKLKAKNGNNHHKIRQLNYSPSSTIDKIHYCTNSDDEILKNIHKSSSDISWLNMLEILTEVNLNKIESKDLKSLCNSNRSFLTSNQADLYKIFNYAKRSDYDKLITDSKIKNIEECFTECHDADIDGVDSNIQLMCSNVDGEQQTLATNSGKANSLEKSKRKSEMKKGKCITADKKCSFEKYFQIFKNISLKKLKHRGENDRKKKKIKTGIRSGCEMVQSRKTFQLSKNEAPLKKFKQHKTENNNKKKKCTNDGKKDRRKFLLKKETPFLKKAKSRRKSKHTSESGLDEEKRTTDVKTDCRMFPFDEHVEFPGKEKSLRKARHNSENNQNKEKRTTDIKGDCRMFLFDEHVLLPRKEISPRKYRSKSGYNSEKNESITDSNTYCSRSLLNDDLPANSSQNLSTVNMKGNMHEDWVEETFKHSFVKLVRLNDKDIKAISSDNTRKRPLHLAMGTEEEKCQNIGPSSKHFKISNSKEITNLHTERKSSLSCKKKTYNKRIRYEMRNDSNVINDQKLKCFDKVTINEANISSMSSQGEFGVIDIKPCIVLLKRIEYGSLHAPTDMMQGNSKHKKVFNSSKEKRRKYYHNNNILKGAKHSILYPDYKVFMRNETTYPAAENESHEGCSSSTEYRLSTTKFISKDYTNDDKIIKSGRKSYSKNKKKNFKVTGSKKSKTKKSSSSGSKPERPTKTKRRNKQTKKNSKDMKSTSKSISLLKMHCEKCDKLLTRKETFKQSICKKPSCKSCVMKSIHMDKLYSSDGTYVKYVTKMECKSGFPTESTFCQTLPSFIGSKNKAELSNKLTGRICCDISLDCLRHVKGPTYSTSLKEQKSENYKKAKEGCHASSNSMVASMNGRLRKPYALNPRVALDDLLLNSRYTRNKYKNLISHEQMLPSIKAD